MKKFKYFCNSKFYQEAFKMLPTEFHKPRWLNDKSKQGKIIVFHFFVLIDNLNFNV